MSEVERHPQGARTAEPVCPLWQRERLGKEPGQPSAPSLHNIHLDAEMPEWQLPAGVQTLMRWKLQTGRVQTFSISMSVIWIFFTRVNQIQVDT